MLGIFQRPRLFDLGSIPQVAQVRDRIQTTATQVRTRFQAFQAQRFSAVGAGASAPVPPAKPPNPLRGTTLDPWTHMVQERGRRSLEAAVNGSTTRPERGPSESQRFQKVPAVAVVKGPTERVYPTLEQPQPEKGPPQNEVKVYYGAPPPGVVFR
ncbi:MAG: hypothetical protein ACLPP2_02815 [Thermoplasmata archaeon]